MDSLWLSIAAPVLGFLATLVTIAQSRRQDRATATKTSAEALQVVQETTLNLLDPMQRQIDLLRKENAHLTEEFRRTQDRLDVVEDDRDILAASAKAQVEWEDSGRLDPPGAPHSSPRVRRLLEQLSTNDSH